MFLKIVFCLVVLLFVFLGYVSTRDGKFRYERSAVINASPDKIFPHLVNLKTAKNWVPFEQKDPNIKRTFSGPDNEVGATAEFEGNMEVGAGKIEILNIVPNQLVEMRLTMFKPIKGENLVQYKLTPEGNGTRMAWIMSGDGGFTGKLISTLIDCEKMIADQFTVGINNLKMIVENETKI